MMNQAAFFIFYALKPRVSVFQTKDDEVCRQKVLLNLSLVLYFENYERPNLHTKCVRNFQQVLS